MVNRNFSVHKLSTLTAVALLLLSSSASAEESAYEDLNACVKGKQTELALQGAAIGTGMALISLAASFFSQQTNVAAGSVPAKKNDAPNASDVAKAMVAGAAVGGVAGFATAYYTAIGTCQKLNPSWVPESKIIRDPVKSYAQVNRENKYKPKDGIKVMIQNIKMAASVKAGTDLDISSIFDVMTPDGAETAVVVGRKLFVVEDGVETPLPFPGQFSEVRTVAAGRSTDSVTIPISPGAAKGTVYKVELSVAADGKAAVVQTKTVTVV